MSCRSTALSVFFLLFLLKVQSFDLTNDFDLPEIDGSAVDTCMIFPDSTTTRTATTTTTTRTTVTTTPITEKQVVSTTKKPAVHTPAGKPETKNTRTPIRPQPAPAGPITDSHSNSVASLLDYLLANSRRHAAGTLPGFNSFIFRPMGGLPQRGYSSSDSDESAASLLKRAGRMDTNRWKTSLFSSEDSSDES